MKELLFLEPIVKELIWGLEYWTVSAHPNGDGKIKNGAYAGRTLSWLWENRRELFGNIEGDRFPLLVKKIDAREDLSIQVHPNDVYAGANESGSFGKTECWYIVNCKPDGTIIVGHHAKSKAEAEKMIQNNEWTSLLREVPIKKGDFFQIEPGTVHAIKNNTVIMEIQQSSDITYRLYDYGRLKDGRPRELHIQKSLDVMQIPYEEADRHTGGVPGRLVSCDFYAVDKLEVEGEQELMQDKPFQILSVIEGEGDVDGNRIVAGDSFIIPYAYGAYRLTGKITVLITSP
ncbi:MAG: class I mannose-6-phosphate isomerase [Lachnospiraceae bacterium]